MKRYAGEEFLNKLYKDLIHSEEVKHTAKGANKNEDLAIYLERLERISKEARYKDRLDLLKHFYYKKYVIKEDDVPEKYFENLEQIAFERGYGHITYTERDQKEEIDSIIAEQKESLNRWLEYFVSDDTKHYPMWFKYYVFQNIMKIGYYDKEKNEFTKRTDSTVKPFIEINREAIAMLYDELYRYLDKQEVTDEKLEQLIKNGSFNKIYSYIIRKLDEVKKSNNTNNEGIWKKYEQGSNPEILFNDIHGKGTGWCTAGGIGTATNHLEGGDFYVYYTKDENGEYANPRIAIRMEYDNIAEVRGIAKDQNLENEMESVVEEKLQEFPDKDEYLKKVSDMKILTRIYTKFQNEEELTKEDLIFLYEVDEKIVGFGYFDDPRIEEIKKERSIKSDLPYIFDLKPEEISTNAFGATKGNKKLHYGNLNLNDFVSRIKGISLPEIVMGSLYINHLESAQGLILPKKISGDLILSSITTSEGLVLPEEIRGDLNLGKLSSAEGLILPKKIGGNLNLRGLTTAKGLELPKGLKGWMDLSGLTSAENLILPSKVNYGLCLDGITDIKDLVLPEEMIGELSLIGLKSAEGLILPKILKGRLSLDGLLSAKGIVFPEQINGSIELSNLASAEGLVLPKLLNGGLNLTNLLDANWLILPKKINGDLTLLNLLNAKNLILPDQINGMLSLWNLTNIEGIMLPKNEQGEFYVPGKLECKNFTAEDLIEAAKRTELNNRQGKIFEDIDETLNTSGLKI